MSIVRERKKHIDFRLGGIRYLLSCLLYIKSPYDDMLFFLLVYITSLQLTCQV